VERFGAEAHQGLTFSGRGGWYDAPDFPERVSRPLDIVSHGLNDVFD